MSRQLKVSIHNPAQCFHYMGFVPVEANLLPAVEVAAIFRARFEIEPELN